MKKYKAIMLIISIYLICFSIPCFASSVDEMREDGTLLVLFVVGVFVCLYMFGVMICLVAGEVVSKKNNKSNKVKVKPNMPQVRETSHSWQSKPVSSYMNYPNE